jgi:hypothetical protein
VVKYDYLEDNLVVDGAVYQLQPYRIWLIQNHEQLCSGHFIRAIRVGDRTKFTYDWQTIFLKAEEYLFLNQYIDEYITAIAQQVPRDLPPDRSGVQ